VSRCRVASENIESYAVPQAITNGSVFRPPRSPNSVPTLTDLGEDGDKCDGHFPANPRGPLHDLPTPVFVVIRVPLCIMATKGPVLSENADFRPQRRIRLCELAH